MKTKRVERTGIFIFCIFLNLFGKYLAAELRLPIWLDMTGTCVSAYFFGLPFGLIAALLNNLVFGLLNGTSYIYALTSVICAVFFSYFAKKGYMDKLPTAVLSGFWLGAVSIFVSTPINIITNGGYTYNIWGDALIDMLIWRGAHRYLAAVFGELIIDIIDKQICVVLGYVIINHIKKKFDIERIKNRKSKMTAKGITALFVAAAVVGGMLPIRTEAAADEDTVNYSSTIYNNLNGLMSSEANTIAETDDGYIWIGSYAGLTRYDGTSFEFMRAENIAGVRDLLCDSQGRLWIGTNDGGVFRYNNGEFTQFTSEDGLPSNSVRCFYETDDGRIYAATTDKLCCFYGDDTISTVDLDLTYIVSMTMYEGKLICVSKDGLIYAIDGNDIVAVSDNPDNQEFTFVQSTDGAICAGTSGRDIYVMDIEDGAITVRTKLSVPLQNIKQIIEDSKGRLWICGGDGIGYLDDKDKFTLVNVSGFESSLEDIYEDYQGNIWAASSSCGVMKLTPSLFDNIFTENGITEEVCNAVASYDGCRYCGTDSGLIVIEDGTGRRIENELTGKVGGDRVRDIMVDSEGRLWVCTYGENGLICMDKNGKIKTYTQENSDKVTSNRVRCITQIGDDKFAVGTADGIFFIESERVTDNITKQDGLENSQILALFYGDNGYLYAGSDGAGIYVILDNELIGNISTGEGLSSDVIMRFVPYESDMFIVTSNSLCVMRDADDAWEGEISVLSEFPYYNNYDILINGETAYVLSSAGIYSVDAKKLADGSELVYSLYSAKSGLLSGITANSWNYVSDDGILYICCNDGVVTFDSKNNLTDGEYRYGLTRIVCDGEIEYVSSDVCRIPKDTENVTLSASLRNYTLSDVKVKFFVEGEEKGELVSAYDIRDINLVKPKAGEYTVHFQIYDMSGSTMLDETTYTLIKEAQMWEKPWYKAYLAFVCVESAIILLWSLMCVLENRRRSRELEEFAKKLEEKVLEQRQKLKKESEEKDKMLVNTVIALSGTVDAKDRYTSGHSSRVAEYAKMLAARMGKSKTEQDNIYCAGLLHDVGKIRVPEAIINKPGKLTADEYEIIKLHPITGYHILKGISPNSIFAEGAKFHHERYDGKGYPNGLAGEAIPEVARIIGVADAYDAMASNRSYRSAMSQKDVRAEIERGRGTQFDPYIADIMLELIDEDEEYRMREEEYSKTKVLIAGKDGECVETVKKALSDEKIYNTECVSDYDVLEDTIKKEKYDIILLDVNLTDSDIYEAVTDIRKLSAAPIILITADKTLIDTDKGRSLGVDDFITKPFVTAALKEIVHAVKMT